MTLPAGYRAWCEVRGVSPYHPDEWGPIVLEDFLAWKLGLYWAKWKWSRESGYSRLLDTRLKDRMRDDLQAALALPPSRPYKACPCHPGVQPGPVDMRDPDQRVTDGELRQWIGADPFVREGLQTRTQRCLAWLAATFGGRKR